MTKRVAAAVLAAVLLTACSPVYRNLPTLPDVPEMERLAEKSESRRHRMWNLTVGHAGEEPYAIVAEETGADRTDELIVLIHGLMSDHSTWQFVSGHLGETRRLWIPDQLGCGESGRPDPEKVGDQVYSPTGQARLILEALRLRNEEAGWPDRIVFVGHSLGGAVVLRILGVPELRAEYPRILERVDRAVLIAPLGFAVHRANMTLEAMSRAGGFLFWFGRVTGILNRSVARELIASAERPEWVFKFDADRILESFQDRRNREATQEIIRRAVPFNEETRRPDWPAIERLVADYGNVDRPVLIVWGNRDETLPLSMGYKLAAELPNAKLLVLEGGKHSLQADRPEEIADLIEGFLAD